MSPGDARDVDWPLVEGAAASRPTVRRLRSGRVEQLILAARRLPRDATPLELGFTLLQALKNVLEVDRVGLYLRSKSGRWLSGLVGTNARGQLLDERHLRHAIDPVDDALWRDCTAGRRCFEVIENAPWIAHEGGETHVLGRGWLVKTPIVAGDEPLGHLYNDAALSRAPFRRETQELVAVFLSLAADALCAARDRSTPVQRAGLSKLVGDCLELLEANPAASNEQLARRLGVTANRLARTFRGEMRCSLLEHRNELRLKRFFTLAESAELEKAPVVLVDLALEAGFGSYSQFHRIFSAHFGQSPRRYLEP